MAKQSNPARILRNLLTGLLLASNSKILGKLVLGLSQIRGSKSRPNELMRRFVDLSQPLNPLRAEQDLPPIDIVTITSSDTFDFAEICLTLAKQNSENPVRGIYALVPDHLQSEARKRIPSAQIISEKAVLPAKILRALSHYQKVGRSHWVLCQILGLYFSAKSPSAGVLVVDADTFLLHPRAWLTSSGRQSLSFSREYHEPYEDHCFKNYGSRSRHFGLSYVTHYMLMQPGIVREIFPDDQAFVSWIESGDPSLTSAVADYHTYGRWLVEKHPKLAALSRWHNKGFRWAFSDQTDGYQIIDEMRIRYSGLLSVSSHRYLEKRRSAGVRRTTKKSLSRKIAPSVDTDS